MTPAQYQAWLRDPSARRCMLVEADYHDGTSVRTLYAASYDAFVSSPTDTPPNTPYDAKLLKGIRFSRKLSNELFGKVSSSFGDIELDNSDGTLTPLLDCGFDGRRLAVYLGDQRWDKNDFEIVMIGTAADITARDYGMISIVARDALGKLDKPIQTNRIAAGPNIGKPVPLAYGYCTNVEALYLDNTPRYQVHDGAIQAFVQVRERGQAVAPTTNIAAGTYTMAAAPQGTMTADVQGEKSGGTFYFTAGDIIERILLTRGGLTAADLDAAAFTAFKLACPQPIGIAVKEDRSVLSVVSEIAASVGGAIGARRDGRVFVTRVEAPETVSNVIEIDQDDIIERTLRVDARELPKKAVSVGYDKRWLVQREGLAGVAIDAGARAKFQEEYTVSRVVNAAVANKHLLAEEAKLFESLFANSGDADAEAGRQSLLFSVIRRAESMELTSTAYALEIGTVVRFNTPNVPALNNKRALVTEIDEEIVKASATVKVWR
jgi:hypothetical protein